jgi:hypothetical protein
MDGILSEYRDLQATAGHFSGKTTNERYHKSVLSTSPHDLNLQNEIIPNELLTIYENLKTANNTIFPFSRRESSKFWVHKSVSKITRLITSKINAVQSSHCGVCDDGYISRSTCRNLRVRTATVSALQSTGMGVQTLSWQYLNSKTSQKKYRHIDIVPCPYTQPLSPADCTISFYLLLHVAAAHCNHLQGVPLALSQSDSVEVPSVPVVTNICNSRLKHVGANKNRLCNSLATFGKDGQDMYRG